MAERHPRVDYIYEPFVWDYQTFNGKYEEKNHHFEYIDSLSFEGIHHHLSLPMLIEDPDPYCPNPYLGGLLALDGDSTPKLMKFVRANGRYLLLQRMATNTRFIFIARNPADTVNSIARMFSFYGGELHHDDFSRFLEEVRYTYNNNFKRENFDTLVEKELFYWRYMNRFALESFEKTAEKPLILCHEELTADSSAVVEKICRFLEIPFKKSYAGILETRAGHNTARHDVPARDFQCFARYLDIYARLLKKHRIDIKLEKKKILEKYEVIENKPPRQRTLYGLTPLKLIKKYEEMQAELAAKTRHSRRTQTD
jgi:hypothetical protein